MDQVSLDFCDESTAKPCGEVEAAPTALLNQAFPVTPQVFTDPRLDRVSTMGILDGREEGARTMGAVLLRPERCMNCGGSMPMGGRIDRRYCKPSCRTLAYRIRKRTGTPARRRVSVPQWVDGQPPVISSALAALADLQARVLHLAHHLEQDDIAYRHPCPGIVEHAAIPAAFPSENLKALANRIQQLEAALEQSRTETSVAKQRTEAAQQSIDAFRNEEAARRAELAAVRAKLLEAGARERQLCLDRDEAKQQLNERTQKLDEARRTEANLRQELGRLQGSAQELANSSKRIATLHEHLQDAATREGELTERITTLETQLENATQENQDLTAELKKARQKTKQLEDLRQTNAATQRDLDATQQQNLTLQKEIERLRPPPAATDPLMQLMKEKVKALQTLAEYQEQATQRGLYGSLFPSRPDLGDEKLVPYNDSTVFAEAVHRAKEMRRDHFYGKRGAFDPVPTWSHQDRLLDAGSEKRLYAKLEKEVAELRRYVERAKRMVDAR